MFFSEYFNDRFFPTKEDDHEFILRSLSFGEEFDDRPYLTVPELTNEARSQLRKSFNDPHFTSGLDNAKNPGLLKAFLPGTGFGGTAEDAAKMLADLAAELYDEKAHCFGAPASGAATDFGEDSYMAAAANSLSALGWGGDWLVELAGEADLCEDEIDIISEDDARIEANKRALLDFIREKSEEEASAIEANLAETTPEELFKCFADFMFSSSPAAPSSHATEIASDEEAQDE